jgi:hypothetical protein
MMMMIVLVREEDFVLHRSFRPAPETFHFLLLLSSTKIGEHAKKSTLAHP